MNNKPEANSDFNNTKKKQITIPQKQETIVRTKEDNNFEEKNQ